MIKAVLMSINRPHTDNIHAGLKTSELRTRAPKLPTPFKVYTYETRRFGGSGKVVSEWTCRSMTEWLMYMGTPAHLAVTGCVSVDEIRRYCDYGRKNITEMKISDLVVYEQPKELSEFYLACDKPKGTDCAKCLDRMENHCLQLAKPPQNWCYVEENVSRA